jgi:uridine phosphorylase
VDGEPTFLRPDRSPAVFEPADYVAHLRERGLLPAVTPLATILCYTRSLVRHAQGSRGALPAGGALSTLYLLPGTRLAVSSGYGIGAPAAVGTMEELIAIGCRRFVSIGIAGCLQPGMVVGDLVICTASVCDEGTSLRYGDLGRYAYPSPDLTEKLERALQVVTSPVTVPADAPPAASQPKPEPDLVPPRLFKGASWTVDAVYRETVASAFRLRAEGVLTVEMEASALFTVAAYRGVEIAAAFAVSDSLADLTWRPDFDNPAIEEGLRLLFDAAEAALG